MSRLLLLVWGLLAWLATWLLVGLAVAVVAWGFRVWLRAELWDARWREAARRREKL